MLPNFLIIGATKAATTSLHHYLNQHPDVYMCPNKETNFFAPESAMCFLGDRVENLKQYEEQLAGAKNEKAIGETSPAYLAVPWTPEKVKQLIPDMKLIAVLRNPAERTYSHYCMRVRQGREDRSFEEVIDQEDLDPEHSYKSRSFYGEQLERWLEHFSREQMLIFLYEELTEQPNQVVQDCFTFLDVDPDFIPDMSEKHNVNPEVEPLSPEMRMQLNGLYTHDVKLLQKHLEQDVLHWLDT